MPTKTAAEKMELILSFVGRDPGLLRSISANDMRDGQQGGRDMNEAIGDAIDATGVNLDGIITADDLMVVSDHIRATPALYGLFVLGHGDDNNNFETGYHLVQDDGGTLRFQGRDYVDTIADAIYHAGFTYADGRLRNEDGNANERLDDVAGWLNYFVNGHNIVYGSGASETLSSGDYSGMFYDAMNETFYAGNGNDYIWAGDGNDKVLAGRGDDHAGGGDGDDVIDGNLGEDRLMGDGGRDRIYGGDDRDVVSGGDHSDWLYGGAGADRVYGGTGHDNMAGGAGFDELGGGNGNDTMWGEAGNDRMWGDGGFDKLFGGRGEDEMGGGAQSDLLMGHGGRDRIGGDEGNDRIYGGGDNDVLYGGTGFDRMSGDAGYDEMHGGDQSDFIYGGAAGDLIYGGRGNDVMRGGDGFDEIHGQDGNDRMTGDQGNDEMSGGDGDDLISGGSGDDSISAGAGADTISGGRGADVIQAWESSQSRDVFIFASGDTGVSSATRDTIEGFASGIDKIDLTGFGGLRWAENGDFAGTGQGEVGFLGQMIVIDADGDGQIDAMIEMVALNDMVRGDFIL